MSLEISGLLLHAYRIAEEYLEKEARKVSKGVIVPHSLSCVDLLLLMQIVI